MNTTSKFVVLSALAALMIAGTMAVALSDDANAQLRVNRNNLNLAGAVNGQNSGDTASAVGGSVGNDNIVAGGNACSQCNAQDGDTNNQQDSQNN